MDSFSPSPLPLFFPPSDWLSEGSQIKSRVLLSMSTLVLLLFLLLSQVDCQLKLVALPNWWHVNPPTAREWDVRRPKTNGFGRSAELKADNFGAWEESRHPCPVVVYRMIPNAKSVNLHALWFKRDTVNILISMSPKISSVFDIIYPPSCPRYFTLILPTLSSTCSHE